MDFQHLTNIAIKAALAAGKIIQQSLNKDILVEKKEGGSGYASQVVTKVDKECERVILSHLNPTCKTFDIGLLTEETEDDNTRFKKDFFWCIDPLDGTLAFINKQPGFSVAIALISRDGTPQIGVVYNPSTNNLYAATKDKGAYKNGEIWKINQPNTYLTYVTDKKLIDTPQSNKIEKLLNEKVTALGLKGFEEISGSGAVLNAILVAENPPAMMLKFPTNKNGGGSIWDFAATACIFKELGLQATNFKGGKLDLNKVDTTFMNHQGVFYSSLIDN
ncbi:MAG: 3'(2'),5'-bisphosphate nucleotidase CysQ [Polaribacter sp.]